MIYHHGNSTGSDTETILYKTYSDCLSRIYCVYLCTFNLGFEDHVTSTSVSTPFSEAYQAEIFRFGYLILERFESTKPNIDYKVFLRSTVYILHETLPTIMFTERAKLQAINFTTILLYICIERRENGNE